MLQTKKKIRQGPTESATLFSEGTTKLGNDGNMWIIVVTDAGVHRWSRINKQSSKSDKPGKPDKPSKTNKTSKTIKNKTTLSDSVEDNNVSQEALIKMTKKYNVTSSGSKKQLAERLWYVSGSTMSVKDLHKIVHLLSKDDQKKVNNEIKKQIEEPITNYMGMWYPQPKPLNDMSRAELLKHIRKFRESYEKITTRNQDLGDERLVKETDKELRNHLKWYFSDAARILSEGWLRDYKPS
jgi:hypothetical protein